ncbi:hypothetical protein MTR67_017747, partial [Solanum verrucosum]
KIPQQLSRLSRLQNLIGKFQLIYHIVLSSRALSWNTTLLWGKFLTKNLTSLEELYLSYNTLERQVLSSLARLTKLRLPGLSLNSLSGEFPAPLYYLSSLEIISLSFNNFSGNLRFDLGNYLPNLLILYLAKCHFIGSIFGQCFKIA